MILFFRTIVIILFVGVKDIFYLFIVVILFHCWLHIIVWRFIHFYYRVFLLIFLFILFLYWLYVFVVFIFTLSL